jgi:hypothetical protein
MPFDLHQWQDNEIQKSAVNPGKPQREADRDDKKICCLEGTEWRRWRIKPENVVISLNEWKPACTGFKQPICLIHHLDIRKISPLSLAVCRNLRPFAKELWVKVPGWQG